MVIGCLNTDKFSKMIPALQVSSLQESIPEHHEAGDAVEVTLEIWWRPGNPKP